MAVTKCILGVLADDLLGMDLTLVDPRKVVKGEEREMEVVIMAFVVVAKRKGIILHPKETVDWLEEEDEGGLQEPMLPDVSFSSSSGDVCSSPTPVSRGPARPKTENSRADSSGRNGKTVLDEILEEFGG